MEFFDINVYAVLGAAVAAYALGMLWHGPIFGKVWIKLMEISPSDMKAMQEKGMGAMAPQMIAAFVQQVVLSAVIAYFITALNIVSVAGAMLFALVLGFGVIAMVLLNGVLWENRKPALYLFNIAHHLVSLLLIASIVTLWR